MKFNQLIYFAAVCQYGTVTEAARQLHISQPSLTSSIRQLESEYQVNLFHRVGRHLTLTREGEQLSGVGAGDPQKGQRHGKRSPGPREQKEPDSTGSSPNDRELFISPDLRGVS